MISVSAGSSVSSPAIAEQFHLLRVAVVSKLCSTAAVARSLRRGHRWCSRMSLELTEPVMLLLCLATTTAPILVSAVIVGGCCRASATLFL
ncbi:hypothetical protein PIB30_100495, partial [Stylosanthes scabra]|nr:hypothetical protein [Stylosanthes scabra]